MTNDLRIALLAEKAKLEAELAAIHQLLGGAAPSTVAPARGGGEKEKGTRERLSQEAIEEALAQIIKLLEKNPSGLRSEQIRADLKMNKKLFQYAANLGRTSDQLTQSGERRLTVYALPKRSSKAQEEGRVIKKKR